MSANENLPDRAFGWWDMFVHEDDDPRADGGWNNDERSMLLGSITDRRLTLKLKCSGLDAEQMACASVPPSDMSLLGLVRHLTAVENYWFQQVIAGADGDRPYHSEDGTDLSFDVAPDAALVDQAWSRWRAEIARSDAVMHDIEDLGQEAAGESIPVREILLHLIREYAQHQGHADLIRERIDGRIGQ